MSDVPLQVISAANPSPDPPASAPRKRCGCPQDRSSGKPADEASAKIFAAMKLTSERAAMCLTCRHAPTCAMGKPDARLMQRVKDPEAVCPHDRWPGADGLVRVVLTFEGVPYPVRVRRGIAQAWMVYRQHTREGMLYRGCGCVKCLVWIKPLLPWGRRGWARKLAAASRAWRARRRARGCDPAACPVHGPQVGSNPTAPIAPPAR